MLENKTEFEIKRTFISEVSFETPSIDHDASLSLCSIITDSK